MSKCLVISVLQVGLKLLSMLSWSKLGKVLKPIWTHKCSVWSGVKEVQDNPSLISLKFLALELLVLIWLFYKQGHVLVGGVAFMCEGLLMKPVSFEHLTTIMCLAIWLLLYETRHFPPLTSCSSFAPFPQKALEIFGATTLYQWTSMGQKVFHYVFCLAFAGCTRGKYEWFWNRIWNSFRFPHDLTVGCVTLFTLLSSSSSQVLVSHVKCRFNWPVTAQVGKQIFQNEIWCISLSHLLPCFTQ